MDWYYWKRTVMNWARSNLIDMSTGMAVWGFLEYLENSHPSRCPRVELQRDVRQVIVGGCVFRVDGLYYRPSNNNPYSGEWFRVAAQVV